MLQLYFRLADASTRVLTPGFWPRWQAEAGLAEASGAFQVVGSLRYDDQRRVQRRNGLMSGTPSHRKRSGRAWAGGHRSDMNLPASLDLTRIENFMASGP